jgi:leucyl-tRNA synthetase
MESLKYNTAIAALMEYLNELQRRPALHLAEARAFALLLAPLAPFIAEELWARLGQPYSVHQQRWPEYDADLAAPLRLAVPVQIGGKTRDVLEVPAESTEAEVLSAALASEKVQRHLQGRQVRKTIYVPGRMLNLVV